MHDKTSIVVIKHFVTVNAVIYTLFKYLNEGLKYEDIHIICTLQFSPWKVIFKQIGQIYANLSNENIYIN